MILEGLAYLTLEGLEHGSLRCSNILLGAEGDIKISKLEVRLAKSVLIQRIAGHECCKEIASTRDVKALGHITMELM